MAPGGTGDTDVVANDWTEYAKVPYYWAGRDPASFSSVVMFPCKSPFRRNIGVIGRLQVPLWGSAKGL